MNLYTWCLYDLFDSVRLNDRDVLCKADMLLAEWLNPLRIIAVGISACDGSGMDGVDVHEMDGVAVGVDEWQLSHE